jgi:gamma-glutamylcyclotransferase (GGCT)/AIG2-like uncharacterized protein YtfP
MVVNPENEQRPSYTGIRVFVYGTLKRGRGNNRFLEDAELLGRCIITGKHTLVDLGYYPGLVENKNGETHSVVGEVYRINRETLDTLDMLEGHPDYYSRAKVQTPWKGAWCYFLPDDYINVAPPVPTVDNTDVQVWRPTEEEREYVSSLNP